MLGFHLITVQNGGGRTQITKVMTARMYRISLFVLKLEIAIRQTQMDTSRLTEFR